MINFVDSIQLIGRYMFSVLLESDQVRSIMPVAVRSL